MLSVFVDNYSINCLLRLKLFDPVKKESFVHLKFDIIPPVELQVSLSSADDHLERKETVSSAVPFQLQDEACLKTCMHGMLGWLAI